jgi:hypothetical protein
VVDLNYAGAMSFICWSFKRNSAHAEKRPKRNESDGAALRKEPPDLVSSFGKRTLYPNGAKDEKKLTRPPRACLACSQKKRKCRHDDIFGWPRAIKKSSPEWLRQKASPKKAFLERLF